MEVKAILKNYRQSPRKARLVANLVRGLNVLEALNQLKFKQKKACRQIAKLINSAKANAVHNFSLKPNNLYIKTITVDQGPTLKRWRARAFGRAGQIKKRTSHIKIILEEKKSENKKTEINKKVKAKKQSKNKT